jgi:DNA-binding NarL/FixJ family response regulator
MRWHSGQRISQTASRENAAYPYQSGFSPRFLPSNHFRGKRLSLRPSESAGDSVCPMNSASAKRSSRTKVLVVSDEHPVVMLGLRTLFRDERSIDLVGHAPTATIASSRVKKTKPDAFLVTSFDIAGATRPLKELRELHPEIPVVVFLLGREEIPKELTWNGAYAVIGQGSPREAVVSSLRSLATGADDAHRSSEPPSSGLSRRELQVLTSIAEGFTNKQVADELGISVRTVETHRERLMRKLDVQGTAALTKAAISLGLVHTKNR